MTNAHEVSDDPYHRDQSAVRNTVKPDLICCLYQRVLTQETKQKFQHVTRLSKSALKGSREKNRSHNSFDITALRMCPKTPRRCPDTLASTQVDSTLPATMPPLEQYQPQSVENIFMKRAATPTPYAAAGINPGTSGGPNPLRRIVWNVQNETIQGNKVL